MMDNKWTSEFERLRSVNADLAAENARLVDALALQQKKTEDLRRGLVALVGMIEAGRVNG